MSFIQPMNYCGKLRGADVHLFVARRAALLRTVIAGSIVLWIFTDAPSWSKTLHAKRSDEVSNSASPFEGDSYSLLLPPQQREIADDDSWTSKQTPPQRYMREFYWQFTKWRRFPQSMRSRQANYN
jgi:hypothetical protein